MAETGKPSDKQPGKPADAKPIVDVAHPGKSAPSGNSKSVIVTNRPILKDPMVVEDNAAKMPDREPVKNSQTKVKGPAIPGSQSATTPLLENEVPDKTAELKPNSEKVIEPANNQPEAETPAKPDSEGNEDVKEDDGGEGDGKDKAKNPEPPAGENESQAPAKGSAEQLEAEAAAEAKHQAEIAKLADSKQYYLPINTAEKRRSRRFIAIGVIFSLLLVIVWVDVALDAGLIRIHGVKSVTHFFSR